MVEATGPLQGPQAAGRRVKEEQEDARGIVVEEQPAIAGAITLGADGPRAAEVA